MTATHPDPSASERNSVEYDELKRRLGDPDWTLVDVFPARVYRKGHLPTARNLPLDDIERRAPVVLPDREAEIVLYCRSEH